MEVTSFPSVESFRAFLEDRGVSTDVNKTYRSGYRRMVRDLSFHDLSDFAVMAQYRVSMKQGTRNVFDSTYGMFRKFMGENGVVLPDSTPLPRIRMAHPLMHDVLTLTGYLNVPQLATLTWGSVPEHAVNGHVERALERIYEFQTGKAAMTTEAETPLITSRNGTPMREWQIEHIVNSVHHETDHRVDRAAKKFTEALVHAGVSGIVLRDYATLYWNARPNLVRAMYPEEAIKEMLALIQRKDFVSLRRLLVDKGSKLAGDCYW